MGPFRGVFMKLENTVVLKGAKQTENCSEQLYVEKIEHFEHIMRCSKYNRLQSLL